MIADYRKGIIARRLVEDGRDLAKITVWDIDELLWADAAYWFLCTIQCSCHGLIVDEGCWLNLTEDDKVERMKREVEVRVQR